MKRKIKGLLLLAVCACMMLSTNVFAAHRHVNVNNSSRSSLLIIGDSRIVQMSDVKKKAASYNATWGAHYINQDSYDKKYGAGIGSKKKISEMKKIVKDILTKQGKCTVIICGTDNDGDGFPYPSMSFDGMNDIKKALSSVKVNGKKTSFYMASAIPAKGEDKYVKKLNKAIKSGIGKSHYIDCGLTSSWKKYYDDEDDDHFTNKGVKRHYSILTNAIK